ncbi:MAG: hypothetical protein IKR69_05095 [Bacteroidales bacterium]|nr:hypothetical protein [Bacteroidales bacterium]
MKKLLSILSLVLVSTAAFAADDDDSIYVNPDKQLFNHLSLGVSLGTDIVGFDVAMPATPWLQLRAGYSIMPLAPILNSLKKNGTIPALPEMDIKLNDNSTAKVSLDYKLNNFQNGHILADFYPFKRSSFRFTVGLYGGTANMANVFTAKPLDESDRNKYVSVDVKDENYHIQSDSDGNVSIAMKVNAVKPYVGIGFGRAVSKHRVNVTFDLGAMYWGSPSITVPAKPASDNYDSFVDLRIDGNLIRTVGADDEGKVNDSVKSASEIVDLIGKFGFFPVLKVGLVVKLF